ncbi:MAG: PD-(D/E)XK nuclease family protein [Dokdonella sp.]
MPEAGDDRLIAGDDVELQPARSFHGHIDSGWWMHSFSQLRDERRADSDDVSGADDEIADADFVATAESDVADGADLTHIVDESLSETVPIWPSGAEFGTALHEILEHTDFAEWRDHDGNVPPESQHLMMLATLRRHALAPPERSKELLRIVTSLIAATLNVRLPDDLRLADLALSERRAELPFYFAIGNADPARLLSLLQEHGYQRRRMDFARLHGRLSGLMTGIIDLVYCHAGRWWLVDYKSNLLGARLADYTPAALNRAVHDDEYDLQYLIYSVALHRWLRQRLGSAYDYERDFGGACYLFVRGLRDDASHGVHIDKPPFALIDALDRLLTPASITPADREHAHG